MRTSGAPAETALTYIPIGVAIVIVVMMFGGPWQFLMSLEAVLRSIAEGLSGLFAAAQSSL